MGRKDASSDNRMLKIRVNGAAGLRFVRNKVCCPGKRPGQNANQKFRNVTALLRKIVSWFTKAS
jgi:hypothetical protein